MKAIFFKYSYKTFTLLMLQAYIYTRHSHTLSLFSLNLNSSLFRMFNVNVPRRSFANISLFKKKYRCSTYHFYIHSSLHAKKIRSYLRNIWHIVFFPYKETSTRAQFKWPNDKYILWYILCLSAFYHFILWHKITK